MTSQVETLPGPSLIEGMPNLCGSEGKIVPDAAAAPGPALAPHTGMDVSKIRSALALALHMHQPTIPAGGQDLRTAALIGNLQCMFENPGDGDNHNASVFAQCYSRIADFVRNLADAGHSPRIMLDYSGNLLWNLDQMGRRDILDNLATIASDLKYARYVDWLGTMWGHAVVPSTPVPDFKRHMLAWRHHFAALFGLEALARVRGFSPPEMHLPNDPDVAYAFVQTLRECGYTWVLLQEHTVENPDGSGIRRPHIPHRLVARNSDGDEAWITALIKTQGSDTKLVAQMQPLGEARGLSPVDLGGVSIPPLVSQIGDGENGGVMMNEFPHAYNSAMASLGREGTVALNGTEYLELIEAAGVKPEAFPAIQPLHQARLWARFSGGGRQALDEAIEALRKEDHRFHMDGGSWTNNLSWVHGYDNVLSPMQRFSAAFNEKEDKIHPDHTGRPYRNALVHLLCSQTSCFRYWGQGRWTDYAIEICRRGMDILNHDW